MAYNKESAREHRRGRIRKKIRGTDVRPRLAVYRSLKNFCAQIINDLQGKTLLGLSTLSKDFGDSGSTKAGSGGNVKGAKEFGKLVAKKALEKKIDRVVFDRGGYLYHGRIRAFAEGAREGGLKF